MSYKPAYKPSANPGSPSLSPEHQRQAEPSNETVASWRKWGPYVSERSWGSVREDYSPDGNAWEFLTHDMARSKAYRWGEDGIAGICDRYQLLVFALALWNGPQRTNVWALRQRGQSWRRRQRILVLSR